VTVAKAQIIVEPNGRTMTVDILNMAAVSQTTYDAMDGGNTRSLPLVISATTTFYLAAAGDYQVSAKIGGREIAGAAGTTQTVTPPRDGAVTVTPQVGPLEVLDLAAIVDGTIHVSNSAAATTPGSVVKKIQVFDLAGASLGYLAVYSAIT
jgi:hypothetical protein